MNFSLWHRKQKAELDEEIRAHLEAAIRERMERGESRAQAEAAARREFGNVALVKEVTRDQWGWAWFETLAQDLRYGARQLRHSPGFTLTAVLTLALGIGANTAIFSAVNPVLFEPLPYPHPEQIVMVWDIYERARSEVTFHTYRELAQRTRSFAALAILEPWQPTLRGPSEPERLNGQYVSHGYFAALGVTPALGRDFQATDEAFRGPKVAILSHGLWQRRFGGDRGIVGSHVTLDGEGYTVVGVMPRGFENVLAPGAEIWSPAQYDPGHITETVTPEWGHHLRLVGRLRPEASLPQAKAELDAIARTPVAEFPRPRWADLRFGFIVDALQADVTRSVKPALLAVMGAVMLVLLVACVNVTNLLLARGAQRRGEFAMRAALGASRRRLVRQLLTESLLLCSAGGALGLLFAEWGVQGLIALSPPELPRLAAIGLHPRAFLFALGITALIGVAVGMAPALRALRGELQAGVKAGQQISGGHQWTRRTLVVVEVALALVLLVSAGLLLRSAERLFAVDPGFDAANLLTMQVQTAGPKFADPQVTRQFFAQALEETRRVPGVLAAAFTSLMPLTDDTQFGLYGTHFELHGRSYNTFRYVVTPGYFEAMRIPLRRGRALNNRDTASSPFVAVISETLAKQEFGDQNPVGRRMGIGPTPNWRYTIVGVASDVRQASLAAGNLRAVYITPQQSWYADQSMTLVVRARGEVGALVPAIKRAVWFVDKDQPIVRVSTGNELLALSAAERRFVLILLGAFSMVALALAAVGIYGVLSGSVTERTREIGVRLALGAGRGGVLSLVFRQWLTLTAIGVVLGLAGAAAASQMLVSMLFGVSALDLLTYLGVTGVLVGVSGIACWFPARRAVRVDPIVALRHE
ncbi:MAG: ADOP family duplicated permease [Candidatus Acidiferrales bacterium]